jgi:hypothetical protein
MKDMIANFLIFLSLLVGSQSCNKDVEEPGLVNNQPAEPSNPYPGDNQSNVNINPTLHWVSTDPDPSDTLRFDIYFDSINPPNKLLVSNWKKEEYAINILKKNKTYFWRVTAHDLKGASAVGPIWRFTTGEEINDSSLVAFFSFNGNVNDYSIFNNHGVLHGAALIADRFGNSNSAIYFNGSGNYVEVLNDESINFGPNEDFTFCLWIKFGSQNFPTWWYIPFFQKTDPSLGYSFGTQDDLAAADITTSGGRLTIENGGSCLTEINTDTWTFLAMVISREQHKADFYVNGLYESHASIQGLGYYSIVNSGNLFIGTNSAYDRFFKGAMDEVRIYKRTLSPTEILSLYQNDNTGR